MGGRLGSRHPIVGINGYFIKVPIASNQNQVVDPGHPNPFEFSWSLGGMLPFSH